MTIVAKYNGEVLATQQFSVRTWPTNFHQVQCITHNPPNDVLAGNLQFIYQWESESGDILDLEGIKIGEQVYYEGDIDYLDNNKFIYQTPPYRKTETIYYENPTNLFHIIGQTKQDNQIVWNSFKDTHRIPTISNSDANNLDIAFEKGWLGYYSNNQVLATQKYRFQDQVLMGTGWKYFPETYEILKTVSKNNDGQWQYRCEKKGYVSTRILPNQ